MRYLLDTCAVSEAARPRRDSGLVRWFADVDEDDLYMSVLTVGELEKGIVKLPASRRKERLRHWLEEDVKKRFGGRLFDVTVDVAVGWARTRADAERTGRPLPTIDSLIAATAIVNDCVVVTRNTEDMERCGAEVVCPWSG